MLSSTGAPLAVVVKATSHWPVCWSSSALAVLMMLPVASTLPSSERRGWELALALFPLEDWLLPARRGSSTSAFLVSRLRGVLGTFTKLVVPHLGGGPRRVRPFLPW